MTTSRCRSGIGDRKTLTVLEASKETPERLPDVLADPSAMMNLATELVGYRKTGTYRSGGVEHRAEFGVRNVLFSGLIGEPLVAIAALVPVIAYLLEHGMRIGMFTNGVLMDGPVIDVLVGAAYVNLSLDAATADTYSRLKFRGYPAGRVKFARAMANLTTLLSSSGTPAQAEHPGAGGIILGQGWPRIPGPPMRS